MKIIVQATKREGFDAVWRAGRKWPSDEPTEVEVLDQAECPEVDVPGIPPGKPARKMLDPQRIGREAFAKLEADRRLSIRPAGDLLEASATAVEVSALKAKLAQAEDKANEMGKSYADLSTVVEAKNNLLADQAAVIAQLTHQVAEKQAEIDALLAAPPKTEETAPPPPAEETAPAPAEETAPSAPPAHGGKRKGK
jgi:hypothetical protein